MKLVLIIFLATLSGSLAKDCSKVKKSNSKLFCYYSKLTDIDGCYCSHIILPSNSDVKSVERVRQYAGDPKILVTVNEFNKVSFMLFLILKFNSNLTSQLCCETKTQNIFK